MTIIACYDYFTLSEAQQTKVAQKIILKCSKE